MIDWSKYYFGITKQNEIYITRGSLTKSGVMKPSKSAGIGIKTEEILKIVGRMLRNRMEEEDKGRKVKRNYFGYNLNRIGKLYLVRPGYTAVIRKESKMQLPVQLDEDYY